MTTAFLQIVVSVWIGAHPVTITLPKIWSSLEWFECQDYASDLMKHRKNKRQHIEVECVESNKRNL